jgi:D-glycero-alpha-D-manno-heptose-7-phosphate kinase
MIISKTPYRISFFGGGSDYPDWYRFSDGEVISTTINQYVYLSLRYLPPYFDHKYVVSYSKVEKVKKINDINHNVVREALNKYKIKKGLVINYDGDIPSNSGMGSSSAFTVGLLNCLNEFLNRKITGHFLATEAINLEQEILKENVGSQDQIAAAYGGFNNIIFSKKKIFEVKKMNLTDVYKKNLENNLFLYFSGQTRIADKVAKTYKNSLAGTQKKTVLALLDILKEGKKIIKQKKLDDFGYLLDEAWDCKKKLSNSITNDLINKIYKNAKLNGALGGKLLGAGGGGFFLFYVPKGRQYDFQKKMDYLLNIPFKFTNHGSQIILNTEKNIKQ